MEQKSKLDRKSDQAASRRPTPATDARHPTTGSVSEAQCFFKFLHTCVENVRLVQLSVFGYVAAD